MFQFRRFPSYSYGFRIGYLDMNPSGLLHSDIRGSMLICSSPRLFAAYHVFHRLLVPRHSPCALCSLTIMLVLDCRNQFSLILPDMISHIVLIHLNQMNQFSHFAVFIRCSIFKVQCKKLVGSSGIEPPTSRLSGVRSNRLSYEPIPTASPSLTWR